MNDVVQSQAEPILLWRASARLLSSIRNDAAEADGTSDEIAVELSGFMVGFNQENVKTKWLTHGFSVRMEIEPEGAGDKDPAEDPVRLWEASATIPDAHDVFDVCHRLGNGKDDGHQLGTARELGAALARTIKDLQRSTAESMQSGTGRFFLVLEVDVPRRSVSATLLG